MHYYPDGGEGPTVSLYSTRRISQARTTHRCDACPEPIKPGQPYVRSVYVEDGVFGTFRCHLICPQDQRELEEQFAADQVLFNQGVR